MLPRVLSVTENYPLKLATPLAHQRNTEFSSVITILERSKFPKRYEEIDPSPTVPSMSSEARIRAVYFRIFSLVTPFSVESIPFAAESCRSKRHLHAISIASVFTSRPHVQTLWQVKCSVLVLLPREYSGYLGGVVFLLTMIGAENCRALGCQYPPECHPLHRITS